MMRLAYLVVLLALTIPITGEQQQGAATDRFARLRFMVGSWKGPQSGQPGSGTSERDYAFVLDGKFLQVKNKSAYPAQQKNKAGEIHEDMGMIGYDRGRQRLVFRQFHTEGFVNTYVEEPSGDPQRIVFTSEAIENIPAGWRTRETYILRSPDEFIERFELAAPGKDFELYSEATLKRVR